MYKVMIAEDEEFILEGIANLIDWESFGIQVTHLAVNGQEALKKWEEEAVDIIITDITMPIMDGLELIQQIREKDTRVRIIIISGYDEFEYARRAISMGVDDYILKPIDDEELTKVLQRALERLGEIDAKSKSNVRRGTKLEFFLTGKMTQEEEEELIEEMKFKEIHGKRAAAKMQIRFSANMDVMMDDIISYIEKKFQEERLQAFCSDLEDLLLLIDVSEKESLRETFQRIQNEVESYFNILTFVSIGETFTDYMQMPEVFRTIRRLEKYRIILGYGACVDEDFVTKRQSKDIVVDAEKFHKMILGKDKEGASDYLEDLFINNANQGEVSINDIYRISFKISLIFQEIIDEYKLTRKENGKALKSVSEVMDELYKAEDISGIKAMFTAEIIEIIDLIHEDRNKQYTPVIRQVLSEVSHNYKEEMSLKTLAHKYRINTSYLGQLFQREVGCSFSQHLSNVKNGKARELILNTNMRINDIAREVGYPDTSYFYRKFKQCYGVSPASLRDMKKY